MKALRMEAPGDARIVEVPTLTAPNPGEVLLKVHLIGLCGTDLTTFRGGNAMVQYPRILGHEVAATVVTGSDDLAPGTAVTLSPYTACGTCASCRSGRSNACLSNQTLGVQRDGALTEFISVPRARLYPADLSLKQLALVEPLTVGAHAAARGRIAPPDIVAVFGCGGIGLGAIAASAFRGAQTIAIDVDDAKLEVARLAGAHHLINTASLAAKGTDLHATLQAFTHGHGPDAIVEAIGLPQTFRAAVEEVAFTGRVVYIGYAKEPVAYETRLFVQKELDILGSRNALHEDFLSVVTMLEAGRFPVDETVTATVPLAAAPAILADWSAAPSRYTKIMVDLNA
jgi:threonine dehydrogenase-like Zn-dependent dehydrogenase